MSLLCLCTSILSILAFAFVSSFVYERTHLCYAPEEPVTPWLAGTTFDGLFGLIFPLHLNRLWLIFSASLLCSPRQVQVRGAFPASDPGVPQSRLTVRVPPAFSEKPSLGL